MRCLACNRRLSDYEASMKTDSGHYLDLCLPCYRHIKDDVRALGNPNLYHASDDGESEDEN